MTTSTPLPKQVPYVGCHNNTRKPLGTMADKELREAHMAVHIETCNKILEMDIEL